MAPQALPGTARRRRPSRPGSGSSTPLATPATPCSSLFRRNFARGHYRGLFYADPPDDVSARLGSLTAFLEAGTDDFALADHVDRWRRHPGGYQVMFVRYEHLTDAWPDVASFVGIDPEPRLEVRPRRSDWRALPTEQRSRIDEMYGDLASRIESLPPVEVI